MIGTLALGLSLLSGPAAAHHNKGLPHYGYFENYPQVPTDDYIRIDGKWEVGGVLFNFQGLESRETSDTPNDIKFYVYAYDLDAKATVRAPIDFTILKDGEVITRFQRLEPDQEGVYITRETLPSSGDYVLQYDFEDRGQDVTLTLPFHVDLAADAINWPLLGGMGLGVAVVFGLALSGRRRRHAPRAPAATG
ncbi:MAG: hypothetical protein H6739_35915 [Alphaproteobacteria bacterium]|nr:hypothetical protein [Alphaproteobacteria bacterium]